MRWVKQVAGPCFHALGRECAPAGDIGRGPNFVGWAKMNRVNSFQFYYFSEAVLINFIKF